MTREQRKRLERITGSSNYIPVGLKVCRPDEIDRVLSFMEFEKENRK